MKSKVDKYKKYLKGKKIEFIRNGYQYITMEICQYYMEISKLFKDDISKIYDLKEELKNKYGVLDIEAINILNENYALCKFYVELYKNVEEFNEIDLDIEDTDNEDMPEIDLNKDITNQLVNYSFNTNDNYSFEEND